MEKALKFLKRMKQTDTPYNFRECELDEAIAELEAQETKSCEWEYNEFDEAWDGKCGVKFQIAFDTPKSNNMNFCPQCGGKLIEIEPKEQL